MRDFWEGHGGKQIWILFQQFIGKIYYKIIIFYRFLVESIADFDFSGFWDLWYDELSAKSDYANLFNI